MKRDEVSEIIACLGGERIIYHYFKDRYCLDMLGLAMDTQHQDFLAVSDIKSSDLKRYIQKPAIKSMLQNCGNGQLHKSDLATLWPCELLPLRMELSVWGEGETQDNVLDTYGY